MTATITDMYDITLCITCRRNDFRTKYDTHCSITPRFVISRMDFIKWPDEKSRTRPQRSASTAIEFEPLLTDEERDELSVFTEKVRTRILAEAYIGPG